MISLRNQSLVGFVLVSLASWAQAYTPDDDGSNPRQYAVDASGNWGDNQNWDLGSPNSRELFAVFDEAYVPYGHTVVTDEDIELDGIHFNTPGTINLAGVGAFNLMGNEREASLNGWQGHQVFQARVNLQNTLLADIRRDQVTGAPYSITFENQLGLNGNQVVLTGGGELVVNNLANVGTGLIRVREGVLSGSGVVAGSVAVESLGRVAPRAVTGNGPAMLNIAENATFQSGSGLAINLYANGVSDVLSGSGSLEFQPGSLITLNLADGYVPEPADAWQLLANWTSMSGPVQFDLPDLGPQMGWNTSDTLVSGGVYAVHTDDFRGCDLNGDGLCTISDLDEITSVGNLKLVVDPAGVEYADLDKSGVIDAGDLREWLRQKGELKGLAGPVLHGDLNFDITLWSCIDINDFGIFNSGYSFFGEYSDGDFNGDGVVDIEDFGIMNQRFDECVGLASPVASAVPEPGSWALALLAAIALSRWRVT